MRPRITRARINPSLRRASLLALGAVLLAPAAGLAQSGGTAVVQPLPSRESLQLSAALAKLGRNPKDIESLVDAGNAASALGDFEAAIGFFKRAQALTSNDSRVLAGLAGAYVRHADPVAAIPLFAQAEAAGADAAAIGGNRGLAYDLVGDPITAQRYYLTALAARPGDDELIRRLAVSYAMSGDEKAMDRTIMPLLREQDKAAWRTRAFALAILGKNAEAVKITRTLLPGRLADSITPYLEYMPRLTGAQQAAAANLGIFPRASDIGRDGSAIAAFTPKAAPAAKVATLDKGLVPAGKPLGSASLPKADPEAERAAREQAKAAARQARREEKRRAKGNKRVAPPDVTPSRHAGSVEEPAFAASGTAETPQVAAIMAGQSGAAPSAAASPRSTGSVSAPAPGFDLAALPASQAAPAAKTAPPPSFNAMFDDLGKPQDKAGPAAGAVDIRKIKPARPAPPPPSHPSRIWVQLGIGQKLNALAFDWKRFEKAAPEAFKGQQPFTARLNQTNRLLAGPFASQKEASAFIAALRKAGVDGPYLWTSPAGQVVDSLPR